MIILLHVLVATGGIVLSVLASIKPSQNIINAAAMLVGATFLSGFLLILKGNTLTQACFSGLAYLTINAMLLGIAVHRLSVDQQI